MARLKIDNLPLNADLDKRALAKVHGGRMSFGWLRPYTEQTAATPFNVLVGQVNVYNLIDPVFNTVNQVEYTRVDISNVADSTISNAIAQRQNGVAG